MEVNHQLEILALLQPWEGPRLTTDRWTGGIHRSGIQSTLFIRSLTICVVINECCSNQGV